MSEEKYTVHVGNKFHPDGSVRRFPGNTIISFVDSDEHESVYELALLVQQVISEQPYKHKFAFLPPSSFHMTVFELLCDEVRGPASWSKHLPLTADLAVTDRFFIEQFADIPQPSQMRMQVEGLWDNTMAIRLKPADEHTEEAVWTYRNRLVDATGIKVPNFDDYIFHLSTMYPIYQLTADETKRHQKVQETIDQQLKESGAVFAVSEPALTFFDDMFQFVRMEERHTLQSR